MPASPVKTNSGPSTLDSSASGLGSGSLAPERTENGQAPTPFWLSLESVPGGVAFPTSWKLRLGPDFDAFKSLFLKPQSADLADFVPCPWNCGCFHKVVPQDNGTLLGLCQCAARACDDYTVLPEERIPLELDWTKLARLLCRAFGLQPSASTPRQQRAGERIPRCLNALCAPEPSKPSGLLPLLPRRRGLGRGGPFPPSIPRFIGRRPLSIVPLPNSRNSSSPAPLPPTNSSPTSPRSTPTPPTKTSPAAPSSRSSNQTWAPAANRPPSTPSATFIAFRN